MGTIDDQLLMNCVFILHSYLSVHDSACAHLSLLSVLEWKLPIVIKPFRTPAGRCAGGTLFNASSSAEVRKEWTLPSCEGHGKDQIQSHDPSTVSMLFYYVTIIKSTMVYLKYIISLFLWSLNLFSLKSFIFLTNNLQPLGGLVGFGQCLYHCVDASWSYGTVWHSITKTRDSSVLLAAALLLPNAHSMYNVTVI